MTTKYFALLTSQGAAKLANMAALGTKLQITEMAVGDGGGTLPTPDTAQTKLISEWRRAAINSLSIDAANSSQIVAEQVIPESEGGFWIREIGLYDADGDLIAVANCPETYKPKLAEGSGRTQTVRMILIVNSTSAVTLKVDPSVVLATRKYADDKAAEAKTYTDSKVIEVKAYADDKMAKHLAATDPHTQYAPKNSPVLTGIPKAPTAAAGDNSTQLANTAFVSAAIAALTGAAPEALDTLKELADSLGNDPHFSTTVLNALAGKMDKAKNGSDIADVAAFLTNLGLGKLAKLDKATIATGGTGADTAAGARAALGVPAGADRQVCSAWVNYDGTSGGIRDAHNVSSVVRLQTGRCQINFAQQMSREDYAVSLSLGDQPGGGAACFAVALSSSSSTAAPIKKDVTGVIVQSKGVSNVTDYGQLYVVIFGGK